MKGNQDQNLVLIKPQSWCLFSKRKIKLIYLLSGLLLKIFMSTDFPFSSFRSIITFILNPTW